MARLSRTVLIGLVAFLGSTLSGCIAVGGSDHYTKPTLGRQLMDLKSARETGAINDDEYQQAKDHLLHGRVSSASVQ